MPKISELAALLGRNLAEDDYLTLVDKSDTTMGATGTNKQMTIAEARLGMGVQRVYTPEEFKDAADTDDTASIVRAVEAAGVGGVIELGAKTYNISDHDSDGYCIRLKKWQWLRGQGRSQTILKLAGSQANGTKVVAADYTDTYTGVWTEIHLSDFTINGDRSAQTSGNALYAVYLKNTRTDGDISAQATSSWITDPRAMVERVCVQEFAGHGFYREGKGGDYWNDFEAYNCTGRGLWIDSFDNTFVSPVIAACAGVSIYIADANTRIYGGKIFFAGSGGSGLGDEPYGIYFTDQGWRSVVVGIEIQDTEREAIVFSSAADDNLVVGALLDGIGSLPLKHSSGSPKIGSLAAIRFASGSENNSVRATRLSGRYVHDNQGGPYVDYGFQLDGTNNFVEMDVPDAYVALAHGRIVGGTGNRAIVNDSHVYGIPSTQPSKPDRLWNNGGSLAVSPLPASITDPRDLDDLAVWFDATDATTITADASNIVTSWVDKSKFGHNADETSTVGPTYQPTGIASDGAVYFGDGKYTDVENYRAFDRCTIFLVLKMDNASLADDSANADFILCAGESTKYWALRFGAVSTFTGETLVMGGNDGTQEDWKGTSQLSWLAGDTFRLMVSMDTDGTMVIEKNSTAVSVDKANGTKFLPTELGVTATKLNLGGFFDGTGNLKGAVAQIIVYNRVLSAAEVDLVDAWLVGKGY